MTSNSGDFASSKLEDLNITRDELNSIGEALKKEEFRKLLCEYVEEIQNPENRKLYEDELTELEKQRGVDITFVTPKACFVVKTSSNGNVKTFINICSNENIGTPSSTPHGNGLNWQVPYVLAPARLDYDKKQEKCNVYDVVFHPDSIELGKKSKDFKQLILDTALNGIEQSFKVTLDKVNLKYPNIPFKGSVHPTVLRRKADKSKNPPKEPEENKDNLVQKSYNKTEIKGNAIPSQKESHQNGPDGHRNNVNNGNLTDSELNGHSSSEGLTNGSHVTEHSCDELNAPLNFPYPPLQENKPVIVTDLNAIKKAAKGGESQYATPQYVIKEYNDIDMDNYTNDMYCKSNVTIPSKLIVEIKLPLLKTMEFTKLDICERKFEFVSEKPSKYRLNLTLPYAVNDENGSAKFEMDRKLLVVTLPVVYKNGVNLATNRVHNSNGITSLDDSNVDSGKTTAKSHNLTDDEKTLCDSTVKGAQNAAINETNTCSKRTNNYDSTKGTTLPNTNSTHVQTKTPTEVQNNSTTSTTNYLEIGSDNQSMLNVTIAAVTETIEGASETAIKPRTEPLVEVIETEMFDGSENTKINDQDNLTCRNATKEHSVIESGANENDNVEASIDNMTESALENDTISGSNGEVVKELSNGVSEHLNNPNELEIKTEVRTKSDLSSGVSESQNKSKDVLKDFWSSKVFYSLPEYQVNASENQLVFVFNVVNVEQDSVKHALTQHGTVLGLQFVSTGAGFFRSPYGIVLRFDHPVSLSSLLTLESNIILRVTHTGCLNTCYYVSSVQGGHGERRECIPEPEYYMEQEFGAQEPIQQETTASLPQTDPNTEQLKPESGTQEDNDERSKEEDNVINGQQSKEEKDEEGKMDIMDCREMKEESKEESDKENQDEKRGGESKSVNIPKSKSTSFLCDNGQQYRVRGILKTCSRSLSISSEEEDEDHYSSSCSVKKHVRFDEHISRKLFSSKCTILEQEKKYQKRLRHLSHKRERRLSETEVSDGENHRDRNNKCMSKKQAKKMNRTNRNNNSANGTNNSNSGAGKGGKKPPGTGNGNPNGEAAASWDSLHSETSEDELKTSCSCSATSESGNTSDSGDSGAASGDFEEMKLSMLAASRKQHKRHGKKNARKSASSAKTAAASGGEFGNSFVFELDMN